MMKNSTIIYTVVLICLFLIVTLPATLKIHKQYPTLEHLYKGQKVGDLPPYIPNLWLDEISLAPSLKVTSFGKYRYGAWGYEETFESKYLVENITNEQQLSTGFDIKRSYEERRKDALLITRRDGEYYWDSNGGKLLKTTSGFFTFNGNRIRKSQYDRKQTIFSALDGSGVIIITHDRLLQISCDSHTGDPYSSYIEIRANKRAIFYGYGGFFPPKPNDWCEVYYPREEK